MKVKCKSSWTGKRAKYCIISWTETCW